MSQLLHTDRLNEIVRNIMAWCCLWSPAFLPSGLIPSQLRAHWCTMQDSITQSSPSLISSIEMPLTVPVAFVSTCVPYGRCSIILPHRCCSQIIMFLSSSCFRCHLRSTLSQVMMASHVNSCFWWAETNNSHQTILTMRRHKGSDITSGLQCFMELRHFILKQNESSQHDGFYYWLWNCVITLIHFEAFVYLLFR